MIFIKDSQLPTSNVVPLIDKTIGVVDTNNAENRIFVLPKVFKGLDLEDDSLLIVLQVQPVNKKEVPYTNFLFKEIIEDKIALTWNITRVDTKQVGALKTNLLIMNTDNDVVWKSYEMQFVVVDGIDINMVEPDAPPSLIEQLVAQAKQYADEARQEFQNIKDYIDGLGNPLIVIKDTYYEFPNIGDEKTLYIAASDNFMYRWDEIALKYYKLSQDLDFENDKYIIIGGDADG